MHYTCRSLSYCKQPLNNKSKPCFNDGKWSLPQQKQLIPTLKKRSLNPIKIKQIYDIRIKDQLSIQRHQKSYQPLALSPQGASHKRCNTNSQPKQFRIKDLGNRTRQNSFGNSPFRKMGDRFRCDIRLMGMNNNSWMNG